jgi:hypothetical protein
MRQDAVCRLLKAVKTRGWSQKRRFLKHMAEL